MLENIISKFKNDTNFIKTIFISSFVVFLLAYLHSLTHEIAFHDNVWIESMGATFTLGRFSAAFIYLLVKTFFGYRYITTPVLNGVYCYIFLFSTIYLLIKFLDIKNRILVIIISSIMIANPFVSSALAIRYDSAIKGLAILLGIIAIYLYSKNQKYILISTILIAFSLGIYQAFISFFVSLSLLYTIKLSIEKNYNVLEMIKYLFKHVILYVFSVALYFILLKLSLYLSGYELDSYKNANNIISTDLIEYFRRALYTYKLYFNVRNTANFFVYNTDIIYYIIFILSIILIIIHYKKIKISSGAIVAIIFFPIAVNLNAVLFGIENYSYSLMGYSIVFQYILLIYLLDLIYDDINVFNKVNVMAILYFTIILVNIYVANLLSLKAEFIQTEAKSYFTNLILRIESTDGYDPNMEVCFVNELKKSSEGYNDYFEEFNSVKKYNYIYGLDFDEVINNYAWRRFMRLWNGYTPKVLSDDEYKNRVEVINMPSYPKNGSIKVINNVVVVKFAPYD